MLVAFIGGANMLYMSNQKLQYTIMQYCSIIILRNFVILRYYGTILINLLISKTQ